MSRARIILVAGALLAGCSVNPRDFNREPHLTPVGSGLKAERVPMLSQPMPTAVYAKGNSFWQDGAADLFRDPRAIRIGDVVTVKIAIKDKASLDSTSNRARELEERARLQPGLRPQHQPAEGQGRGIHHQLDRREDVDQGRRRDDAVGEHRAAGRGRRHRRDAERQPRHRREPGGARELRGSRPQRRRHRPPARYLDRQHDLLRQDRRGARLLRRTRPDHRGPAAGLGSAGSSTSSLRSDAASRTPMASAEKSPAPSAPAPAAAPAEHAQSSPLALIVPLAILTVVGAGAGGLFGTMALPPAHAPVAAKPAAEHGPRRSMGSRRSARAAA